MNIDLTDEFVWTNVKNIVSKSSILKKEFKDEYLGKVKTYKSYTRDMGLEDRKINRHQKELTQIDKTLGDVETSYRMGEYDSDATFNQIKDNLKDRRTKVLAALEESKGNKKSIVDERKWVDWIKKFGDQIDNQRFKSPEIHKEYLMGLIDKIEVSLNQETQEHEFKIFYNLPIVDDGIRYKNDKKKSMGYDIIEGGNQSGFTLPKLEVRGRKKKAV